MNPIEMALVQSIKSVGVARSSEILSLLMAWEGVEKADVPLPIDDKQAANLSLLGEMVREEFQSKPRGRVANPNSIRQRVFAAMNEYFQQCDVASREAVINYVMEKTKLSKYQVSINACQCPGIRRDYGVWSKVAG